MARKKVTHMVLHETRVLECRVGTPGKSWKQPLKGIFPKMPKAVKNENFF